MMLQALPPAPQKVTSLGEEMLHRTIKQVDAIYRSIQSLQNSRTRENSGWRPRVTNIIAAMCEEPAVSLTSKRLHQCDFGS